MITTVNSVDFQWGVESDPGINIESFDVKFVPVFKSRAQLKAHYKSVRRRVKRAKKKLTRLKGELAAARKAWRKSRSKEHPSEA